MVELELVCHFTIYFEVFFYFSDKQILSSYFSRARRLEFILGGNVKIILQCKIHKDTGVDRQEVFFWSSRTTIKKTRSISNWFSRQISLTLIPSNGCQSGSPLIYGKVFNRGENVCEYNQLFQIREALNVYPLTTKIKIKVSARSFFLFFLFYLFIKTSWSKALVLWLWYFW